jgi:hypothetical protein
MYSKIASLLLNNGANIDSGGWIQVSKKWKFGSPLELAFQLQYEIKISPWKKSVQNLINILLEKHKQLSLTLSKEGKTNIHAKSVLIISTWPVGPLNQIQILL